MLESREAIVQESPGVPTVTGDELERGRQGSSENEQASRVA